MNPVHNRVNTFAAPGYHAVPLGWSAEEIAARHDALGGAFALVLPATPIQPHPPHLTDRYRWTRYIASLRRLVAGVRAGDAACIELAVQYILLRHIGSYSGFLRARLARALKSAPLTPAQSSALDRHFLALVLSRDYTDEFRDYRKLWGQIITGATLALVLNGRDQANRTMPQGRWLAELEAEFQARRPGGGS